MKVSVANNIVSSIDIFINVKDSDTIRVEIVNTKTGLAIFKFWTWMDSFDQCTEITIEQAAELGIIIEKES